MSPQTLERINLALCLPAIAVLIIGIIVPWPRKPPDKDLEADEEELARAARTLDLLDDSPPPPAAPPDDLPAAPPSAPPSDDGLL